MGKTAGKIIQAKYERFVAESMATIWRVFYQRREKYFYHFFFRLKLVIEGQMTLGACSRCNI